MSTIFDFPLLAEANGAIRFQKRYPKEPILFRKMIHARSQYQFAAMYLAFWMMFGREPSGMTLTPKLASGVALARNVRQRILNEPGKDYGEVTEYLGMYTRLTTRSYGGEKGAVLVSSEPSQEARRQAKERKDREGSGYKGTKVLRKREKCRVGDTRYPIHW